VWRDRPPARDPLRGGLRLFLLRVHDAVFFSSPAETRSMASRIAHLNAALSRRAARNAASFTILARSAQRSRSLRRHLDKFTSASRVRCLACTRRSFRVPDVGPIDGDLPVETSRTQQRGSRISGRLVAAMMMMPLRVSKPSI